MRQMLIWPHWRVFLYTMAVPLAFFVFGLFELITDFSLGNFSVLRDDIYSVILLALVNLLLAAWKWTVGHALFQRLPAGMAMNLSLFQASILIPVVYDWVHVGMIALGVNQFEAMDVFASLNCVVALFTLYTFHFMAKALIAVELNRPAPIRQYLGTFFLFLFLFIGIWLLQPRINRIFANEDGIEQHLIE